MSSISRLGSAADFVLDRILSEILPKILFRIPIVVKHEPSPTATRPLGCARLFAEKLCFSGPGYLDPRGCAAAYFAGRNGGIAAKEFISRPVKQSFTANRAAKAAR